MESPQTTVSWSREGSAPPAAAAAGAAALALAGSTGSAVGGGRLGVARRRRGPVRPSALGGRGRRRGGGRLERGASAVRAAGGGGAAGAPGRAGRGGDGGRLGAFAAVGRAGRRAGRAAGLLAQDLAGGVGPAPALGHRREGDVVVGGRRRARRRRLGGGAPVPAGRLRARAGPRRAPVPVPAPAACGRGSGRGGRGALLEAGDALGQRRDRRVGVGAGEADEGDLERDAGVEGVLDPDEGVAQQLEGPGGAGGGEAAGLVGDPGLVGLREPGEVGVDRGEEDVAQAGDQRLAEHPGVAAPAHGDLDGHEGPAGVVVAQRLEQLVDGVGRVGDAAGGDHPVEGGERVAGRAAAGAQHVGATLGRELEPGVGDHEVDQALEVDGREEVDLEVLGAAADGGQHLLRVGGGQHEHDVVGRLLERLQQRVRRRRREHVDLVEDVHLRAPGGAERRLGDEVADGLHAVVGGGVELVDVEAGAALDRRGTRRTRSTARRRSGSRS